MGFARDTLVSTATGLREIGSIVPGDYVHSFDFESGSWHLRQVTDRIDSIYDGPVFTIETGGSTIEVTAYHPFWVLAGRDLDERTSPRELLPNESEGLSLPGRWVNSHELRAGDVLIDRQGQPQTVVSISQRYEPEFPVSNLTIGDFHNFAVGQEGILVHNVSLCEAGEAAMVRILRGLDEKDAKWVLEEVGVDPEQAARILAHSRLPKPAGVVDEPFGGKAAGNAPKTTIKNPPNKPHEVHETAQGQRFGESQGGGELEFYGDSSQGVEGVFRPAGQPGVEIPFSFKSYHDVEKLGSLLKDIRRTSNSAQAAGVKNGIFYGEPTRFTAEQLADFARNGPLAQSIVKDGAFSKIVLKSLDGIVEITADGVRIIK